MKKKCLLLLVTASLVCFSATALFAWPSWGKKAQHADRNKDGRVDKKEVKMEKKWEHGQKAKVNTPREAGMDKNKDGVVNPAEASRARQQLKNKGDLNKDGVIDPKERRSAEGWQHSKRRVNTEFEKKHDGNGDGWIDAAEAKQMMQDRQVLAATGGKAKVNTPAEQAADVNKDGVVDPAEAKTLVS
jgi:hypothetical protein